MFREWNLRVWIRIEDIIAYNDYGKIPRIKPTVVVDLDHVTIDNSHDFIGSVTTEIFNLWLLFYNNAWTLPKGCIKCNKHKSYKAKGNSRRELQPWCLGYKDCSFEAISCKI